MKVNFWLQAANAYTNVNERDAHTIVDTLREAWIGGHHTMITITNTDTKTGQLRGPMYLNTAFIQAVEIGDEPS